MLNPVSMMLGIYLGNGGVPNGHPGDPIDDVFSRGFDAVFVGEC